MSAVPHSPSSPERCSSASASSCADSPSRSSSHSSIPGSTLPERVAITRPSSGVNPIVVSSEEPSLIAHSEAPAPRWQLTIRRSLPGSAEQLRRASRDPGVGEAVEAVAAQTPALAPLCAGSAYVAAAAGSVA